MGKPSFELKNERLGPLPLVNHFIDRLGLLDLLDHFVPTEDPRCRLPYAKRLGVLLRSILTEREPIYRLAEVVNTFAPEGFGLSREEAQRLADDAIGRALDRLFDTDRGSLLTEIVIAAGELLSLSFDELLKRLDHGEVHRPVRPGEREEHQGKEGTLHHLRLLEGPQKRSEAAAVPTHFHPGRRGPGAVSVRSRIKERLAHPRGDLGGALPGAGQEGLPFALRTASSLTPRPWTTSTGGADAS